MHTIDREALDRFARAESTPAEGAAILRHLLKGCAECSAYLSNGAAYQRPELDAYGAAIARSSRGLLASVRASRADALLAELDSHPPQRRLLLCNHRRFADEGLVALLLSAADPSRGEGVRGMIERATLAERISRQLGRSEVRARACGVLGNALRIIGDLREAEQQLGAAVALLPDCADRTLRPRVLRYLVSVRMDQRRFAECHELLAEVIGLWRELGRPQEVAASLVLSALVHGECGDAPLAIATLLEASRILDPLANARLNLILVHNFARFLLAAGEPQAALAQLAAGERLYVAVGDPSLKTRAVWLRGLILAALGHADAALPLLSHTQMTLADRGHIYDSVVASLDLAAVLGQLGRLAEVETVAAQALTLAQGAGAGPEALTAISLLAKVNSVDRALDLATGAQNVVRTSLFARPIRF